MKKYSRLKIAGIIVGIFLASIALFVLFMIMTDGVRDYIGSKGYDYYMCDAANAPRCLSYLDLSEDQIRDKFTERRDKKIWSEKGFKKFRKLIISLEKKDRKYLEDFNQRKIEGDLSDDEVTNDAEITRKSLIYYERVIRILDELGV